MARCPALVVPLLMLLALVEVRAKGVIVTYWGQNVYEGSLREACETDCYRIINIAFLYKFGEGRTPSINLAGHCSDSCNRFAGEIKFCQDKDIKVFLSLGGGTPQYYGLSSLDDAKQLAEYLWTNFLGGQSGGSGPLGDVVLDGIDFDIEAKPDSYWDDLARYLSQYSTRRGKKVYLSAAPQCPYPDQSLKKAIATGLFDYIWIQFYNNPSCQYKDGDPSLLFKSWNEWTAKVKPGSVFLGLPASPDAAPSGGYITPETLKRDILPVVKKSEKYGGVMLWSRYYDKVANYCHQIIDAVLFTPNKLEEAKYSSGTLEYFSSI